MNLPHRAGVCCQATYVVPGLYHMWNEMQAFVICPSRQNQLDQSPISYVWVYISSYEFVVTCAISKHG
jgi:hypothetical protein